MELRGDSHQPRIKMVPGQGRATGQDRLSQRVEGMIDDGIEIEMMEDGGERERLEINRASRKSRSHVGEAEVISAVADDSLYIRRSCDRRFICLLWPIRMLCLSFNTHYYHRECPYCPETPKMQNYTSNAEILQPMHAIYTQSHPSRPSRLSNSTLIARRAVENQEVESSMFVAAQGGPASNSRRD